MEGATYILDSLAELESTACEGERWDANTEPALPQGGTVPQQLGSQDKENGHQVPRTRLPKRLSSAVDDDAGYDDDEERPKAKRKRLTSKEVNKQNEQIAESLSTKILKKLRDICERTAASAYVDHNEISRIASECRELSEEERFDGLVELRRTLWESGKDEKLTVEVDNEKMSAVAVKSARKFCSSCLLLLLRRLQRQAPGVGNGGSLTEGFTLPADLLSKLSDTENYWADGAYMITTMLDDLCGPLQSGAEPPESLNAFGLLAAFTGKPNGAVTVRKLTVGRDGPRDHHGVQEGQRPPRGHWETSSREAAGQAGNPPP